MTCRPAAARTVALLAGLVAAGGTHAACLEFASRPDGAALVHVATPLADPTFTLTYVHSVTRTPVVERYRIDDATIVQTEIGFEQHGPGLPTQADDGGRFERRDGRFVVTMERRFDVIAMRVHADQSPRLLVAGRTVELAAWGNRAVALRAHAGSCAAA